MVCADSKSKWRVRPVAKRTRMNNKVIIEFMDSIYGGARLDRCASYFINILCRASSLRYNCKIKNVNEKLILILIDVNSCVKSCLSSYGITIRLDTPSNGVSSP